MIREGCFFRGKILQNERALYKTQRYYLNYILLWIKLNLTEKKIKFKDQHVVLLRQVRALTKNLNLKFLFKIILLKKEADVRKQKLSLAEACEHSNKMKKELQSRLDEAILDKAKSEEALLERSNELQSLKSETEKNHADFLNSNQVCSCYF